ncbi:SpoIIE family protein phosphatase [Alienimonas californiensis]|uniref:Phosphoserine phosphatase RsbU n=1 Tax=Alienimonas californiensis TaxID=2527989 RepID=A0A517PDV6_9PLAN|nr:SpoIIE family protein phosphatase [Alienimonas californiensis]QDT17521.1 Phosphoserine phosphatase RsbU [Alienimonas californiensis]
MPKLVLLQGETPDTRRISGERAVVGRLPEVDVQIDSNMVSRRHAILSRKGGDDGPWTLEDLDSGNGTFLNGKRITAPVDLNNGDRLKFGPVLARFEDDSPQRRSAPSLESDISFSLTEEGLESATVTGSASAGSGYGLLDVRPQQKLEAVISIARDLAAAAAADDVAGLLPQVLQTLFNIFPGADRGVILLRRGGDLSAGFYPAAQKQRQQGEDSSVKMSRTILRKVVEEKTGYLSADASSDSVFDASESISSLAIRSMMSVPMLSLDGDVTGVIHLDTQNPITQFKSEDLDLLQAVAGQAAMSYESHRLLVAALQKKKQDSEMQIAKQVQRTLLPDEMPQHDGYSFFASYDAAQAVGGDYYDAFTLPNGKIALAFGDVAGKGVPGALVMGRMSACVQSVLANVHDAGTAFSQINSHMCRNMAEGRFVTFVLVLLDPETGKIDVVNGGHMSPLFRSADGGFFEFDDETVGLPVGVVDGYPFETVSRTMQPGETALIITDGVDEAMNPSGDLFTKARVKQFLMNGPADAAELGRALLKEVRTHAAGREQNDDITIMTFGRNA